MKKPVRLNVHAMMALSLSNQVVEDAVDAAEDEDGVGRIRGGGCGGSGGYGGGNGDGDN